MKLLIDFLPVALFFAVYKYTDDIIIATAALIPATALAMAYTWLKEKRLEKMQLATLVLVLIMGSATIIFQDKAFIQWKPTIVNWLFGLVFLGSQFIGQKTVVERLMGGQINLSSIIWRNVNMAWCGFFMAMGALNLYVAYNFSEATWVDFKLFGMLGLTLLFIVLQGIYLSRHIVEPDADPEAEQNTSGK